MNFDVLRRWLTASGYAVTFIRNVTDIDDKILAKGEAQGRPWFEIAYLMGRELDKALDAINVLPPTYEPAATGHVPGDPRADRPAGRRAGTPTPPRTARATSTSTSAPGRRTAS